MLSCRDLAHKHASDYLDGQLSWRARMGVRLHLMMCVNCRRLVRQLQQVRDVLRHSSSRDDQTPSSSTSSAELSSLTEQLHALKQQQIKTSKSRHEK